MQSQSQFEQNILDSLVTVIPEDQISGLVVKDGRVLLSLNITQNQLDSVHSGLMKAVNRIDPDLKFSVYISSEKVMEAKIKYVIAVASGKGGVGKSTVAVNLAFALSCLNLRVALLDADIYGPSVPHMLGLDKPPESLDGKKMRPEQVESVECMSMGLLIPKDQPAIWRGPMVIKALNQMLNQVAWSDRDVMVIDMPPGTGDAQLTLAQNAKLAGVIIVSTPQDLALIDARKGLKMFQTMQIPILGVIENMSTFACPHCGEHTAIFNHGGARQSAKESQIPFLGEIPLYLGLREAGDTFKPFVLSQPAHDISLRFRQIATDIWNSLNSAKTYD